MRIAFSVAVLRRHAWDYARSQGLKVVVSELGGGQQLNDNYIAKGVRGARM